MNNHRPHGANIPGLIATPSQKQSKIDHEITPPLVEVDKEGKEVTETAYEYAARLMTNLSGASENALNSLLMKTTGAENKSMRAWNLMNVVIRALQNKFGLTEEELAVAAKQLYLEDQENIKAAQEYVKHNNGRMEGFTAPNPPAATSVERVVAKVVAEEKATAQAHDFAKKGNLPS